MKLPLWMGAGSEMNWISSLSESGKTYWALYVGPGFTTYEASYGDKTMWARFKADNSLEVLDRVVTSTIQATTP